RTAPWFTFIFLGFGIAAGFKNLYMLTKRKDL
ncbi:MAG: AtpZ/AtpI family protein, partial [Desulfobulbaceae bacterium]|nr:AtpZ/AtpI family protein [Desulfobulbaceae bacterium]